VRTQEAPPDWALMCAIKAIFWGPEDCVVQYHPKASEYVNNHLNVLHLWREIDREFPQPPSWLVGALSPQSHAVPAEVN
jgi:Uma2 family endonuclease